MNKRAAKVISVITAAMFITGVASSCYRVPYEYDYSWAENYQYIAHACGGIDGYTYTNSREALSYNYDLGHRVFEVDLMLSPEGELICWHGWDDPAVFSVIPEEYRYQEMSYDDFMNFEMIGGFHTMDFAYLVNFMADHPDMYVVTDTKSPEDEVSQEIFQKIVDVASQIAPETLDRIIPQIYNDGMLKVITDIYPWKSVILTLYMYPITAHGIPFDHIRRFVERNGIRVVTTFPNGGLNDEFMSDLQNDDIFIYLHTFNSQEDVDYWTERGIGGFYTDFLVEN